MPSCVFPKCHNNTKKVNKSSGITFHKFPRDVKSREKWIAIVRRERYYDDWRWNDHCRICSDHFTSDDIYMSKKGMRKIHKHAMPTVKVGGACVCGAHDAGNCATIASSSSVPVRQTHAPPSDIPESKEVILRVYHYLATEYEQLKEVIGNSSELSPLSDIVDRTARATGISKHTLAALLDEEKRSQHFVDVGGGASKRVDVGGGLTKRVDDGGGGATKRRKLHVENYYDCTSPIKQEEESDSPEQEPAPPDDVPGQAAPQQQYVYGTEPTHAVKQEIDEDQQELMVLFFKEEDEAERDPFHVQSTSTVTSVTCTTHTEVKTEPPDDVTTLMYTTDVSDATLEIEPDK